MKPTYTLDEPEDSRRHREDREAMLTRDKRTKAQYRERRHHVRESHDWTDED